MKGKRKIPHEHEWAFHKLPKAEWVAAWHWEIERAAGSKAMPWLALSNEHRRLVVPYFTNMDPPAVRELKGETMLLDLDVATFSKHGFLIDWSRRKTAIKREFARWVESKPHWKATVDWPEKNRGGRKLQCRAWLTDLAIYRVKLNTKRAMEVLQPVIEWSLAKTKLSPYEFDRSRKRTQCRIDEIRARPVEKFILTQKVFPPTFGTEPDHRPRFERLESPE